MRLKRKLAIFGKKSLETIVDSKEQINTRLQMYAGSLVGIASFGHLINSTPDIPSTFFGGILVSEYADKIKEGMEKISDFRYKVAAGITTTILTTPFLEHIWNINTPIDTIFTSEYNREMFNNSLENLAIFGGAVIGSQLLKKVKIPKFSNKTPAVSIALMLACLYSARTEYPEPEEKHYGFHVEYYHDTKGAGIIPAQRGVVSRLLGRSVAHDLEYGRFNLEDDERIVLIYNRGKGTKKDAIKVATKHKDIFGQNGFYISTAVINNHDYEKLWRLSFGKGLKNLLKKRKPDINKRTGEEVHLERSDDGQYILTTRRYFPKHIALWLMSKYERLLWGTFDNKGKRVALTLERHRYVPTDNEPVFFEGNSLRPIPEMQDIFIRNLKNLEKYKPSNVDIGVAVYSHDLERLVIDYDSKKARQMASVQKLPIAMIYNELISSGELDFHLHEKIKHIFELSRMLIPSSNSKSVKFVNALGGPDFVQNLFTDLYPDFSQGFKFVEYIPDKGEDSGRSYKNLASALGLTLAQAYVYEENHGQSHLNKAIKFFLRFSNEKLQDPSFPSGTDYWGKSGTTGYASNIIGTVKVPTEEGYLTYSIGVMMQRDKKAEDYKIWQTESKLYLQKVNAAAFNTLSKGLNK